MLNLLFRIGIAQRAAINVRLDPQAGDAVAAFLDAQGKAWGGRAAVFQQAIWAAREVCEVLAGLEDPPAEVEAAAVFDELNIALELAYEGPLPAAPGGQPPLPEAVLTEPGAAAQLGMHLLRGYASKLQRLERQGRSVLRLEFEH